MQERCFRTCLIEFSTTAAFYLNNLEAADPGAQEDFVSSVSVAQTTQEAAPGTSEAISDSSVLLKDAATAVTEKLASNSSRINEQTKPASQSKKRFMENPYLKCGQQKKHCATDISASESSLN